MAASELNEAVYRALQGSYTHTILEWTAVGAATIVCVLAVAQYRITRDPSLPIIGVALACAGAMDAFHTLAADRLIHAVASNGDLIPFTWAICRLFNGTIQMIGVGLFALWVGGRMKWSMVGIVSVSLGFVLSAYLIVHFCAVSAQLPQTMYPESIISRPYDLYPLVPFLICAIFVFPMYYGRKPTLFGVALLLSLIPQIATQLYMAFGSTALHDSAFNIAHAMKAIAYIFPAAGLVAENLSAFRQCGIAETALLTNQREMENVLSELRNQKYAIDEHSIVSICDIKGDIVYANDKFCELSGHTRAKLLGENHRIIKSDEHSSEFFRDMWLTISGGETWRGEVRNRAKDGNHYWVDATIVPLKDDSGTIQQYVAIRTDITAMKETELRFKLAIAGSQDGLWDWNLVTNKVYYAPRWQEMLGLTPGEIGDDPKEWMLRIDSRDVRHFEEELGGHLRDLQKESFEVEMRMVHANGSTIWVLCRGAVVRDKKGEALRVAGSLADITDIKTAQEALRHAAQHDRLTGLCNRELFSTRLQQSITRAEDDPDFKFAVLFFDFDRFKIINDSLGHTIGDALLVDIASQFEEALREHDIVARFGGDEFVVLLQVGDHEEAHLAADRLLEIFARTHDLMGHSVTSTASIGLVTNSIDYQSADEMIRDADAAMYEAKAAGKARVVVFDRGMHLAAMERMVLEQDLHRALDRGEFRLAYQPIIDLESGVCHGMESLLRWEHPAQGIISPADFIHIAEDTGLIVPIGTWVLLESCRQLVQWNTTIRTGSPITMHVNLSLRQVSQPNVIEMIRQVIDDTGVDPDQLCLEITESTIIDERHNMISRLEHIRELGVHLAMDDFGTGQSSMSNLHLLPIDLLKIDQSFIKNMSANRELAAVLQAIIMVAQHLGMSTVAEGVETDDQLVMLQSLECAFGQGYLFQRPMYVEAASRFLLGLDDAAATA